jgi:AmmeMemoRadiSam system protein B
MAAGSRTPVVAGLFYSYGREELEEELDGLFPGKKVKAGNRAVISPHAGYVYSGRTAALALSSLRPSRRFLIMGPNHTLMGRDFSVYPRGSWETPIGDVRVDRPLARELLKSKLLEEDTSGHQQEHSVEVQLPILQHRFPAFSFVPLSIMSYSYSHGFLEKLESVGKHMASLLRRHDDVSVVASSDFSHYMPADAARERDMEAIGMIEKLDPEGLFRVLERQDGSVCGYAPIAVLLYIARELRWKARLMEYTNSGESSGDTDNVVGYAAIGFR